VKVGQHDVEVEEPDLVIIRVRAEIVVADAQAIARTMKAHAGSGSIFVLTSSELGELRMAAKARSTFIAGVHGVPRIVNAVVRANFGIRVLGQLVATATRALARARFDMAFFDDEPSARAWLREMGCVACGAPSVPDRSSRSS
jgi:hypothetical protein